MTLSEKLKGIKFKGFHDVDWSEVLMRTSIAGECGGLKGWFVSWLSLMKSSLKGYSFDCSFKQNHNSTILYYYNNTGRLSCEKQFDKATSLVLGDVLKELPSANSFHLWQFLVLIFSLYPKWLFAMRGRQIDLYEKIEVLKQLRLLYGFKTFIDTLDLSKYKLMTSFYDSVESSNYLVHICKLNNITTATLQHGSFHRYIKDKFEMSSVEFRSSFSDYLLLWNKEQYNEAVAEGISPNRIKIVGILGFIGVNKENCIVPENKVFGISISHPAWESENVAMIKAANLLAQSIGYKYRLKLHPNYPEDYFDQYVDKECYIGNVPKGIPMLDYANSVDFTIVGSSSVLNELVFIKHKTIRYSSGEDSDKFINVEAGQRFRNIEDILSAYKAMISNGDSGISRLFDELCTVEDVTNSYKDFFYSYR